MSTDNKIRNFPPFRIMDQGNIKGTVITEIWTAVSRDLHQTTEGTIHSELLQKVRNMRKMK